MNRRPRCPFCGFEIDPPRNLGFQFADFDAGFCPCGAVYVSDVTGYNRGAAFAEALFLACGGNWDLAWDLLPGEDYQEGILEKYDQLSHQIVPEGAFEGRKVSGVLYFVRLAEDLRELGSKTLEEIRQARQEARPPAHFRPRKLRRPEAERLVAEKKFEELFLLCRHQPLNLRVLQKVLYHPDRHLRFRTATYLGEIASRLVKDYPEEVADLVKRLLYASADSAASAWGALETVGEIIRHLPQRFGLYVRNLLAFLKYPEFRPAALYALYRIADKHPELLRRQKPLLLLEMLSDQNPEVRGLALLTLDRCGLRELRSYLEPLRQDSMEFEVYSPEEDRFLKWHLGNLTRQILTSWEA